LLELGKFTLEEIWEIPEAIRRTIIVKNNRKRIRNIAEEIVNNTTIKSIYCFGSGTSYHAGLVSTYWFSQLAHYPTHCELAPEFPYLIEPIIAEKHCCICISQSGESELTLYAATKAAEKGAYVIALTNEEESNLVKIVGKDRTLLTYAGKEKSVLATKTYVSQLATLTALSVELAELRGTINSEQYEMLWDELKALPKLIELILPRYRKQIRDIAPYFKFAQNAFVIGTGPQYANCLEAALKLKEGARIFAQAFSTAEFPHGPITLAESHSAFVLCIFPDSEATSRYNDVLKLVERLVDRGVTVLGIKNPTDVIELLDMSIDIPECNDVFRPIFSIIPVQLLVVEIAAIQGINCDTPKFLSKVSHL
ncbi:MAG: SIS domain-containing protein, partial [Candidatus Lokiarchaeota archaeon]|nr:SIS domain-containing protein [Candidatus Lokiarchaeota archaeon]